MAGRKWTAQYEFYAHRRLALEAGLSPAIADAIAANQRPASMAKDRESVYDFVSELLATGSVSDPTFQRVKDAFGERGVVDLVGAVGYYSLVSMALNVAQVSLPAGVAPLPEVESGAQSVVTALALLAGAGLTACSSPPPAPARQPAVVETSVSTRYYPVLGTTTAVTSRPSTPMAPSRRAASARWA